MRRVLLLALLALALPIAAFADSFTFTNSGGTLSLTGNVLTLTNSSIVSYCRNCTPSSTPVTGKNLGTLTFSVNVGAPASTSTFGSDAGRNFQTTSNFSGFSGGSYTATGTDARVPSSLFNGTFTTNTTLTETIQTTYNKKGKPNGSVTTFSFTGSVTALNGGLLTSQVQYQGGTVGGTNNGATANVVPEPGTLGLLGTGLVGIAGLVRRKIRMA